MRNYNNYHFLLDFFMEDITSFSELKSKPVVGSSNNKISGSE